MSRLDFREFESNGRFGLSVAPLGFPSHDSGDLGRGGAPQLAIFQSVEARGYYKRLLESEERANDAENLLRSLIESASQLRTPKGRIRKKYLVRIEQTLALHADRKARA